MALVWSCPIGSEGVTATLSGDVPTCSTGQGQWIEQPQAWWEYQIPQQQVDDLLSGMLLLGVVIYVARRIEKGFGPKG